MVCLHFFMSLCILNVLAFELRPTGWLPYKHETSGLCVPYHRVGQFPTNGYKVNTLVLRVKLIIPLPISYGAFYFEILQKKRAFIPHWSCNRASITGVISWLKRSGSWQLIVAGLSADLGIVICGRRLLASSYSVVCSSGTAVQCSTSRVLAQVRSTDRLVRINLTFTLDKYYVMLFF